MRTFAPVLALLLAATTAASADSVEETAARAMRDLRYTDARATLEAARRTGGLSRERLIGLQTMLAECTAIVEGAEAGEREYRRLLVIDPEHAPPVHKSPVVTQPFERARAWVQRNGSLKVGVAAISPSEAEVRVTADPLAMVTGARVYARTGEAGFVRVPGTSLHAALPVAPPGESASYYVDVVHAADNVLLRLGSADEPLRAPATPARAAPPKVAPVPVSRPAPVPPENRIVAAPLPPRTHPMLSAGIGVTGLSLALFGAAIGLDVSATNEYDSLQRSCAPMCSQAQLATFRLERNLSYGFYAGGAVAAAVGVVLIIVDRVRAHGSR